MKNRLFAVLSFCVICLYNFSGYSRNNQENFRFEHISIESGLSYSEVNSIIQDSTGFLWIGTRNGLNRYDGNEFVAYYSNLLDVNTIKSNDINHLELDNGDNFWVATKRGISFYESKTNIFHDIPIQVLPNQTPTSHVSYIHKTPRGLILAATSDGIYVYQPENKEFVKLKVNQAGYNFINSTDVLLFATDHQNRIWLGTLLDGVFILEPESGHLTSVAHYEGGINTLKNNKIFSIYHDREGISWIGTDKGLYSFSSFSQEVKRYLPGTQTSVPHRSINYIMEDSKNRLWILTNGGLSVYNRDKDEFNNIKQDDLTPYSISSNAMRTMFEDRQGNLWFGSVEDGLNVVKAHSLEFENFVRTPGQAHSLNYPHVLSVIEHSDGTLWIGTNGGGVNIYNPANRTFQYILPATGSIQADAIMSLFEDKEGNVWIGTYQGGVTVYNPRQKKFRTYRHHAGVKNSLSNDIVNMIYQDSKGQILLATNKGINQYNPQTRTFSLIAAASDNPRYRISSDFITSILEDSQGNLWVGTYYGLYRISPETGELKGFFHQNNELSDNAVYTIFEDSRRLIWIGTDNGLTLYNPENDSINAFYTVDGLPNNTINGLLEDKDGNIWISTKNGLSMLNPQINHFVNYDQHDGRLTVDFSSRAAFKGKDGRMYFGGRKGLTAFDPGKISQNNYQSSVVLTNLFVNNQLVKPTSSGSPIDEAIHYIRRLVLKHDQSFITIDFTSLNFVNPRKERFYYKLDGFDNDWIDNASNRSANYTKLPAGKYSFRVKVLKGFDEFIYSNPLELVIKPPFWLTSWAYALYIMTGLLMIFLLIKYLKDKAAHNRRLFVQKMENEKLIELNKSKLRFFINVSHEFKTPLTLILSPLEKLLREGIKSQPISSVNKTIQTAHRNAMRLSRLITQIMELRKIDTGNLKLRAQSTQVIDFIKNICDNYDDYAIHHRIDFSFENELEEFTMWFDRDMIETALFNILSNAFRYTPEGGMITLRIRLIDQDGNPCRDDVNKNEKFLCIDVIDTGEGIDAENLGKIFERFYQVNNDMLANPASTGIGLSIVKEFIDLHKGCVKVKSTPGQGSTFTIMLPTGKLHFDQSVVIEEEGVSLKQYVIAKDPEDKRAVAKPFYHETARGYPHKVLVVEDNHELRNFILDNLEKRYEVHEASNGREGLRLANVIHPDLIISDIMMPGISGIEFTREIKSDINTSHIPVILMTVLNDVNLQVEGMEIGADAYICKPFHFSVLEANIHSLIENRRNVINKFLSDNKPQPENISLTKLDQAVLNKALEVVEKNMDNDDFSADDFSIEMNMSRSSLHVKLKALTNLSATEFIRTVRLKKAVELLSQREYTISQVSSMVGFKSISYFNRCFKNVYGTSPSNYI
jgi:ligand-binding sensor domain-containing protein/signal transduction histidine kinase/DNA-binding response OmpR family regulator